MNKNTFANKIKGLLNRNQYVLIYNNFQTDVKSY